MEYDDKQIFYVSSRDRISGTTSNFLYNFQIPSESNYDSIVVLAASIPKSYYLISSSNDEFILTEDNIAVNIHIPSGNYTLTSFKAMMIKALNDASPHNYTYNITFPSTRDPGTGKFTYSVTGNGVIQPSFTFGEYLFEQMGFFSGTYNFVDSSLTSINVVNLQLLNAVFISSDICNNKNDCVLQEVYSNGVDFSNLTYQATSPNAYAKKLLIKNSTTCRFYLTDVYGDIIQLNGLEWNFTFMLYKSNQTLDMIRNYIKFSLMQ